MWDYEEIEIGKIDQLLSKGNIVEVDSPDGWVNVSAFVDKGLYDEYILKINEFEVRCNHNHLFETDSGWKYARDLLNIKTNFLTRYGLIEGMVTKSGEVIPIVDITVDHENHRYYTDGISSHNTGGFKSGAMCHIAASYMKDGHNVIYITMEMSESKVAERIDANMLNVDINEFKQMSKIIYDKKIDNMKKKVKGKLIIKEYPTSSAHVGHFRFLLSELKQKKKFKPDIIVVDYLNICASSRMKSNDNSYGYIKAIAEELRGLAVENDVALITASQLNRCLTLDTVVKTRQGQRLLSQVTIGDELLSEFGQYNKIVKEWFSEEEVYEIELTSGNTIKCSSKHLFPVLGDELSSIDSGLSIGDELYVGEVLKETKITSITKIGIEKTKDIELDGNRLFYANNILTHNSGYDSSDVDLTNISECLHVDTKVITSNGEHVNINTLSVGDKILGSNGFVSILKVHDKKRKMLYKVKTKSGKLIICSKEHQFPTEIGRLNIENGLKVGTKLVVL